MLDAGIDKDTINFVVEIVYESEQVVIFIEDIMKMGGMRASVDRKTWDALSEVQQDNHINELLDKYEKTYY